MNQPQEPIHNRFTSPLLVSGFCAVLLIPLLAYGCGPEWARWDAAQAVMAYEQGDVEGAIEQLTAAVERSPRDPSLKLSLADKLIENNKPFQAERVCDEILKRFPDNDPAMTRKAECQQSQGNFEKALKTFKQHAKSRSWLMNDSADLLNMRAYFRALANQELDHATDDIDAAVEMLGGRRLGNLRHSVAILPRSLVASVLVARKVGLHQQAIQRLTPTIIALRVSAHKWTEETNEAIIKQSNSQFPPSVNGFKSVNQRRAAVQKLERTLGLLLTTRALCYQDLKQSDLSDQDRAEVRELGLDADVIVAKLPEDIECIGELLATQAILDTRGFILSLLPGDEIREAGAGESVIGIRRSHADALVDLDQAVFAMEVFSKSLGTQVHNHVDNELDLKTQKLKAPRNKAILVYHRMLVLEKMGETDRAAKDRAMIRKLGFEPGWHLF